MKPIVLLGRRRLLAAAVAMAACLSAAASEISAPGAAGSGRAPAAAGQTAQPYESRTQPAMAPPGAVQMPSIVERVPVPSDIRQEVAPRAPASAVVPGAPAALHVPHAPARSMAPQQTQVQAAPGQLQALPASAAPAEAVAPNAPGAAEAPTELRRRVAPGAAARIVAPQAPGRQSAPARTGAYVTVHRPQEETARAQALSQTTNVRTREYVARLSTDRAWNVNQAQALLAQQQARAEAAARSMASQTARTGPEAVLVRREVRELTVRQESRSEATPGQLGMETARLETRGWAATATPRTQIGTGAALVNVTAQNLSEEVVERPLLEVALPQGVRYRALASAPPDTSVAVIQTQRGEKVEIVLPFALFQHETAQVVIETSPLPQAGTSEVRARVMPLEERLRTAPQAPAVETAPMELQGGAIRQHLHP